MVGKITKVAKGEPELDPSFARLWTDLYLAVDNQVSDSELTDRVKRAGYGHYADKLIALVRLTHSPKG